IPERLQRILERLPEIVRQRLSDLDTLLGVQQVDKGKAILGAFDTRITLHPAGERLDVEISGRIEGLYALAVSAGTGANRAQRALPQPFT
ncbi:MAG TPA: hypothetical protein VJQ83_02515, partial [Tepidiformaceae bacterium]|nr:hypothetical protein [Tepidiformaceae bacterium]